MVKERERDCGREGEERRYYLHLHHRPLHLHPSFHLFLEKKRKEVEAKERGNEKGGERGGTVK